MPRQDAPPPPVAVGRVSITPSAKGTTQPSPTPSTRMASSKADDIAITVDERQPLIQKQTEQLITIETGVRDTRRHEKNDSEINIPLEMRKYVVEN